MEQTPTPVSTLARRWQWLLIAGIVGWLIYMLSPVLTPFVLAALLGWLGDPLVDRLQRAGRSRPVAVTLVFTLMAALLTLALLILVPMIEKQIGTLFESLPVYRDWMVHTALPWVERRTGLELVSWLDTDRIMEWLRGHWKQAGGVAATFFGHLSRSGFAVMAWVANLVLLPILTFYFLRDWDLLVARVAALVPRDQVTTVNRLARESNDVLGAFLRGQILVMLALGAIYAIGLSVVGLKLGLLIGIIAGLISFVPYLGTATGIVLGLVAAAVQSQGDWNLIALVLGVFVVGQMLEGYVLTPRIVGDRIGLHPVAVIFAIMAGGQLFGFLGMLIALPVAAVTNVMLRYAHERYTHSHLYAGDAAEVEPAAPVATIVMPASDTEQPGP